MANFSSTCKTKRRVVRSMNFSKSELDVALQLLVLRKEEEEEEEEEEEYDWQCWNNKRCKLQGKTSVESQCGSNKNNGYIFGEDQYQDDVIRHDSRPQKKRSRPVADLYKTTKFPHVKTKSINNMIFCGDLPQFLDRP